MRSPSYELNLRHLRAIAAVRRCGSISRASSEVALSQPAVTQGIAKLEAQVGLPLFERETTGMAATEAGEKLADRIETAETAMTAAFDAIRKSPRNGFRGTENLVTMSQVRALLSLSASGSFIGAARVTGLSQPSLHRAVRDIERLSGTILVERRGRGVRLTEAGHRLARGLSLAVNEIDVGLDELSAIAGHDSGRIRIGAMPLSRARLLPLAIARFHEMRPTVQIEVVEGPHDELLERLRDGRVDFLIGALRLPSPGPDCEQEALFDDRLMIVARKGHPISRIAKPSLDQLSVYPWVMAREGTPLRALWQAMFADEGLPTPDAPVICGSVGAIRVLLMESDFLTLLSPDQVRLELEAGRLAAIGEPIERTRRPIGLTTRAGWRPGPAQKQFIHLLHAFSSDTGLRGIE